LLTNGIDQGDHTIRLSHP